MATGYNKTFSLYDFFRQMIGSRQSAPENQSGFLFTDQSGQTNSGEAVTVDNLLQ